MKKHTEEELNHTIEILTHEKQILENLQFQLKTQLKNSKTEFSTKAILHALEEFNYSLSAINSGLEKCEIELIKLENLNHSM